MSLFCTWTAAWAQAPTRTPESVLFEDLPVVEAASLHEQTLHEVPASVTVITQEDIRRFGYRTLGEALSRARGFYSTNDRIYQYIGVRGFSLPGDYNTRFLVMLNGHYLTENVYSSNGFFGQDFGLDMDLVKRIEIIRGPSSALYGSNGIFATINIVTRSPIDHERAKLSTETGSFGEKKMFVAGAANLGRGANLLVSGSMFNNRGPDLYYPEYDAPETGFGRTVKADGRRGYHTFTNLVWRDWNITAYFNDDVKLTPISWGDFLFGDRGNRISDSRNFVEAAWSRQVGQSGRLRWRVYYDQYRYHGDYRYAGEDGVGVVENRDGAYADSLGTQISYAFPIWRNGGLTVGMETSTDIRNLQTNFDAAQEYLHVDRKNTGYGAFAQLEQRLSAHWTGYLGLRYDGERYTPSSASPRLALVYQPSAEASYKFLYGKAFRSPSPYELLYDCAGLNIANPDLRPETAHTWEFAAERHLRRGLTMMLSAYHYLIRGLIEQVALSDYASQFRNVSSVRATGVEADLAGKPARWLEAGAILALQRLRSSATGEAPLNSPGHVANLRLAAPLGRKLLLSASTQHLGARSTVGGGRVAAAWVTEATISTTSLHRHFDLVAGARNLFDRRYYDVIALNSPVDRMRQDGRTLFVKLIWKVRE